MLGQSPEGFEVDALEGCVMLSELVSPGISEDAL